MAGHVKRVGAVEPPPAPSFSASSSSSSSLDAHDHDEDETPLPPPRSPMTPSEKSESLPHSPARLLQHLSRSKLPPLAPLASKAKVEAASQSNVKVAATPKANEKDSRAKDAEPIKLTPDLRSSPPARLSRVEDGSGSKTHVDSYIDGVTRSELVTSKLTLDIEKSTSDGEKKSSRGDKESSASDAPSKAEDPITKAIDITGSGDTQADRSKELLSSSKLPLPKTLPPLKILSPPPGPGQSSTQSEADDSRLARIQRIRTSFKSTATSTMKIVSAAAAFSGKSNKVYPMEPINAHAQKPDLLSQAKPSPSDHESPIAYASKTPKKKWLSAKTKLNAVAAVSAPIYGPESIAQLKIAAESATLIIESESDNEDTVSEVAVEAADDRELDKPKKWTPADTEVDSEILVPPPVRAVFNFRRSDPAGAEGAQNQQPTKSAHEKQSETLANRNKNIEEFGAAERRAMSFCIALSLVNFILTLVALIPVSDDPSVLNQVYYGKLVQGTPRSLLVNATDTINATSSLGTEDAIWKCYMGLRGFSIEAPLFHGQYSTVVKYPSDGSPGAVYEELLSTDTQGEECYIACGAIIMMLLATIILSVCRCDATKHRRHGPRPGGNTSCTRGVSVALSTLTSAIVLAIIVMFRQKCLVPSLDDSTVQADYGGAFFAVVIICVLEIVQLFLHASIPSSH